MTIKFARTGTPITKLSIADHPGMTFPDADWAVGTVVVFGSTSTPAATQAFQALFRTTDSSSYLNGIGCNYNPPDAGSSQNKIYFYVGSATSRCHVGPIEFGKAYVLVLQRVGGGLVGKLCPVLNAAPADGSSVMSSTVSPYSGGALDSAIGLVLGEAVVANRRFEHSLGRFFRVERSLTDLEIAQLAYGKEITQIASPTWYLRMNDQTDYADTGAQANVVTAQGALAAGPAPGFGYSSVPVAPTISGAPAISGAAVVDTPVSFTPAQAMGNPFPALTYQWTLNGTDVAGATDDTYTPVAADVGKQLRVRQTANNGVGSPAVATSDSVLVSSTAVGLTVAELTAERIYQRISGAAVVGLSGSYQGTAPAKLEYQLYTPDGLTIVVPWTDIGASFDTASTWTAAPSIPAPTNGKKYRIAVRSKNAGGGVIVTTPLSNNRFGVGDIIIALGSSSPLTWFGDGSGTNIVADPEAASTVNAPLTAPAWALFGTVGRAGQMASYIAGQVGVPVALVGVAQGGSSLRDWQDAATDQWARFVTTTAFVGGKLGGVFASCGSNDVTSAAAAATVDAHLTKLRQLAANARSVTGQPNLPLLLSGINRRGDALDGPATNARQAERDFGDDPNIYHVQNMDIEVEGSSDPQYPGGVHPTGAGYRTQCERIQRVWGAARRPTPVYLRGPKITAIQYEGSTVVVTVVHRNGTDLVPPDGIKGFAVSDDGGPVGVLSAARKDATHILLECNRALVNPKVTYLTGAWPLSNEEAPNAVFDTADYALPMTVESFMAAVPGSVGLTYTAVSKTFTFSYAIDSATVSLPKTYTVSRSFDFAYAIDGPPVTAGPTGSLQTYQMVSSGTLRANQTYKGTWYASGEVGGKGGSATLVEGTTDSLGRALLDGLPLGPGFGLIGFADGGICFQKGTVA